MTKLIPVKDRKNVLYAIVDDYERLSKMSWMTRRDSCNVYAIDTRTKKVYMHCNIMHAEPGKQVDHRDGNGLNNRRSNLRVCNHSQNQCNSRLHRDSRSGYKGVCIRGNKICARIKINGVSIFLGYHATREEAARAYNKAAIEYHGEFARLNEL